VQSRQHASCLHGAGIGRGGRPFYLDIMRLKGKILAKCVLYAPRRAALHVSGALTEQRVARLTLKYDYRIDALIGIQFL
jgi:hypothetical protein